MTLAARFIGGGVAFFAGAVAPLTANADIVISSGATKNMSCSAGKCVPTAKDAVLNVSDLENMLAAGNLTIATAASKAGVDARNIDVETGFSWSTSSSLALDATLQIHIDNEVGPSATAGLSLVTAAEVPVKDLFFGRHGRVVFKNTSSQFSINGTPYALVDSISSLASAIASNPSGNFAFADDYDASADGTYSESPVTTIFAGNLDGLGNTISNLSIVHTGQGTGIGLFFDVFGSAIEHTHLAHVRITGTNDGYGDTIGSLAGAGDDGYFFQDSATGIIHLRGRVADAGGLVGTGGPEIDTCFADVSIDASKAKRGSTSGGLLGGGGTIIDSFATGAIVAGKGNNAGGVVGADAWVENSYATGSVSGGVNDNVGGVTGKNTEQGFGSNRRIPPAPFPAAVQVTSAVLLARTHTA